MPYQRALSSRGPSDDSSFPKFIAFNTSTTLYQRKERSPPPINWASGPMVFVAALTRGIISSIPICGNFLSGEKFRAVAGLQSVNALIRTLKPKLSAITTAKITTKATITKDPYRDLQKVLIGVFGFYYFAPKSDQSEASLSSTCLVASTWLVVYLWHRYATRLVRLPIFPLR